MEKNDYMVSAQNKYLVDLRAIVNYAYLDGIHDNDRAMQYFSKKKIEVLGLAMARISAST